MVGLCGALPAGHAQAKGRDAGTIYAELCAGCHGAKLEGGKGGSLRGNPWKHGGDDAGLARSIRDGYPGAGMPAFGVTVNEAETRALVAFLPDGRMLVTERVGRLRIVESGKLRPEAIGGLPAVRVKDEAGLMSVVAHPDFANNGWIYLSFSDPGPDETAMTKVIRGRLRDGQLVEQETIFSIPPEKYQKGNVLFGGRLVFAGEHLLFSVGVRGMEEKVTHDAQELSLPNGKIHRVFHDGKIPPDNPFVATAGAVGSIWAFGVRNPQGLARNPRDGALWETEHGPRGGDELNHIVRGRNYGWPVVTHGMNYDGTPISEKTEAPNIESPVRHWTPSIAASEIEFYAGDKFPKWKHQLFLGTLTTQKLLRLVIDDGRVAHTEEVFKNFGRVRDIKTGPDGFIYVALEAIGKPGRVVRLLPAD